MHDLLDFCECDTQSHDTMPLIGDTAPEFTAETTNGIVHFPSDYQGKWVILSSHPSDFTPVCTSEFMTFQSMLNEFHELNTDIIGVSVGTLTSHLAWVRAIKNIEWRDWKNMEIQFPIIDDLTMNVSRKYGMVHPNASDTKTVRAVFIIDPTGTIRAILYYPASTGRNFDEIKRILIALQSTDTFRISTPADWAPGDDVLVASPTTSAAMRAIETKPERGLVVRAWFFSFKKLAADTIWAQIRKKAAAKSSATKKKK